MSTPMDKLKGIIQTEIKQYQDDVTELKTKQTLDDQKVDGLDIRIKTLEETIKLKEDEIKKLNQAMAERKNPDETLGKADKGGFESFGDYLKAIGKTLVDKNPDIRLYENNARMKAPTSSNSQSALVGSEGQFLVPEFFSTQILGDMNQYGKILARCFQLPISGPSARIPALVDYDHSSQTYYGGVTASRSKERTQITGTSADFGQVKLELKKLVGMAGITSELVRWSAITVEPILRRMFAIAMSAVIEREIVKGNGNGQMLGLLNSPCKNAVAVESGQSTNDMHPENITKMIELTPDESSALTWIHHPNHVTNLTLLKGAIGFGGGYMNWYDIKTRSLLGYETIKSEFCPAVNTEGDLMLADLGAYIYAYEAGGAQVVSTPYFYFDYDADAIRFTMYNDGQCWWKSRRLLDDGSTYVSPVQTLATRT